jgi:hypothetical protein
VSGHSVLAVPVAPLEPFVRARTERYDASFVSADPGFGHAHVTLLGPWLPEPTADELDVVAATVAAEPPFAYALEELAQTPLGLLMVAPAPAAPFERLTAALVRAFPQTPPYAGAFEPLPHVTLDHTATGATLAGLRGELPLPVEAKAELVQLQWWANHDCRVLHSWRLGG